MKFLRDNSGRQVNSRSQSWNRVIERNRASGPFQIGSSRDSRSPDDLIARLTSITRFFNLPRSTVPGVIMARMTFRRALPLLGIGAAVFLGIVLRLHTRQQLTAGGRVRALTSDDYYHLRRARFAVEHFPRTIVFDPLMNFPHGGVPIWPPLFDVALATPSRILHGPSAAAEDVEREAAWVPAALAGVAVALAGLLGRRAWGAPAGAAMALFVAVSPGHIRWTQYGHTDQHVLESVVGLLVLLLFVASRERRTAASEAWTGLALAIAVLSWQGAIYWGAVLALALFLETLRTRESTLRPALLVLGLPAVIALPATAAWLGSVRPPFTYISFGFFQPLFLAALSAGTILLDTLLRAGRRQLDARETGLRAIVLGAAAVALLPFSGDLVLGTLRGAGYVLRDTDEVAGGSGYVHYPRHWLQGIFEARPLLADGPGPALEQLSASFFLAPVVVVVWALRGARGLRPGAHFALAVWGAVTLLLALSQRLNVYYAAPLAAAALVEAMLFCSARFGTNRIQGALAVSLLAALLLWPMARKIPAELRRIEVPGSDLFSTLDWMRTHLAHEIGAYDPRLLSPPPFPPELSRAGSVLAPWSLGHLVLYNAELPVVANNFGYGFLDSIRFFLAESEEEALALARARRARWAVATDLVPRMNDYAAYLGRPPYLAATAQGLSPTARYFATLQSRLYDWDGAGARAGDLMVEPLRHFRLVHHSKSAIPRGSRWLARWKVFEIVE